jgi:hypothetical protein
MSNVENINTKFRHSSFVIRHSPFAIRHLFGIWHSAFVIDAMLLIDSLLISGVKFVLAKIVAAVDTEMNDDTVLRERLLDAQMRVELGEMSQADFDELEADILVRIREIKERQRGGESAVISPKDMKVTGIEATFEGEEH